MREPHYGKHSLGHHPGECDRACRAGHRSHAHRSERHLYRGEGSRSARSNIERRYYREAREQGESRSVAERHAERAYGAIVGKVRREQLRKKRGRA